MSCVLTSGRIEPCRDAIGGVKNVYLFPYVKYNNSQIDIKFQTLVSFPTTNIFKYEVQNGTFEQNIVNDENGVSYQQSLIFTMFKQDRLTTNELNTLTNIDFRYVAELYDGTFRVGGLFNGAKVESLTLVSGGTKQDLNGYNVTITGLEEIQAPFLDSLDVLSAGANYIFQSGDNFIFMDGNNYIFQ